MKKQLLTFVFLLSTSVFCKGQVTFQKTYGGTGYDGSYSVQQTTDGGYIIGGLTGSFGVGATDFYLVKIDSIGTIIWTRTFGGINTDYGYSVQETTDSGFIISGQTYASSSALPDIYLIKTDVNGNSLWVKTIPGVNSDACFAVYQSIDKGYVISGNSNSSGAGNDDAYLIKLDTSGSLIWTKTYGELYTDGGSSVKQTLDGGYIVAGYSTSFGAGDYNAYLIKTDANGNATWSKTFGGIADDDAQFVQQTTGGGYIVAGFTSSFGAGSDDVYLIKTNSAGNLQWSKAFGGIGDERGCSVKQTSDGGYIITGWTYSFGAGGADVYLIKTNIIGDTLWTKCFGGTGFDVGRSVQQTTDGGYIIAGSTTNFSSGGMDIYLIKTDANGNSGCNQGNPATIVTSPATIVTSPPTIVTSPTTIVTSPATITGSGGIVTTLCISTGVTPSPLERAGVRLFPNPSTGKFTISFADNIINGELEIFSVLGNKIYSNKINNATAKEIQLKNMDSGMYFVKVFDGEKRYCVKLIISY